MEQRKVCKAIGLIFISLLYLTCWPEHKDMSKLPLKDKWHIVIYGDKDLTGPGWAKLRRDLYWNHSQSDHERMFRWTTQELELMAQTEFGKKNPKRYSLINLLNMLQTKLNKKITRKKLAQILFKIVIHSPDPYEKNYAARIIYPSILGKGEEPLPFYKLFAKKNEYIKLKYDFDFVNEMERAGLSYKFQL